MSTRSDMGLGSLKRRASAWACAGGPKGLAARAYSTLSSIKTSIYVLGLMALFFMAGTIFPQGESFDEYERAGGKFLFLVGALDLLEFFSSPLFLLISAIFALNLIICSYERYKSLFAGKPAAASFAPSRSLLLTHEKAEAHETVRSVLRQMRLRLVDKDGEWTVMERGLPWKWLTWAYHAGIIVCLAGVLMTFLFSFEETVALKPGEPRTITPETTGRVQSFWQEKTPPTDFHLLLESFTTEYTEAPELTYPDDGLSRLAVGMGWKGISHDVKDDSLFPKDWWARVKVVRGSSTLTEKSLEINDPLEYGGYTIYLLGYEQTLKLRVDSNPLLIEAKGDGEVLIPGTTAALKLGTLRAGTVTRADNRTEEITPYVTVRRSGTAGEPAVLRMGDAVIVDGVSVAIAGFTESAILSYRYDPGVGVLWAGGLVVLIAMALRFYGRWYLVAYRVDDSDAIVSLDLHVMTRGLLADQERLLNRIETSLRARDIRPVALPPSS